MAQLLMVVSGARTIRLADGSDHPTGYLAEEVLEPYEAFEAAGVDVVIATPEGKVPQPDPWGFELSVERISEIRNEVWQASQPNARRAIDALSAIPGLQHPRSLGDLTDEEILSYDGVFIPGGHGPMVDLADNADVGRIVRLMHGAGQDHRRAVSRRGGAPVRPGDRRGVDVRRLQRHAQATGGVNR